MSTRHLVIHLQMNVLLTNGKCGWQTSLILMQVKFIQTVSKQSKNKAFMRSFIVLMIAHFFSWTTEGWSLEVSCHIGLNQHHTVEKVPYFLKFELHLFDKFLIQRVGSKANTQVLGSRGFFLNFSIQIFTRLNDPGSTGSRIKWTR